MELFMFALGAVLFTLLLLVAGFTPQHDTMSIFERKRRSKKGDERATARQRREALLGDILSLQRLKSAVLLVLLVPLLIALFGWVLGIGVAVLIALEYGALARLSLVHKSSQKLYEKYEAPLLKFIEKHPGIFRLVKSITPDTPMQSHLDSVEELEHLVANSGHVLSLDEKKFITHGLKFKDKKAADIMTPRGVVDTIDKKELLGPLVLSDLHKTGHSRFPVTDGDIDHIVGILHVQDLLTVDSGKRSSTVEKTMLPRVFYIRQDQTLDHALAAFLRTHHHLFIVINEFRETVGVLSLEDTIEALMGRKIVDEFDTHEDLRVVAARNPRGNNDPKKREDV